MERLAYILAVSFGSMVLGYVAKRACDRSSCFDYERAKRLSTLMKFVALLALQPIAIMGAFWKLPVVAPNLYAIPALGVATLFMGGVWALVLTRIARIAPRQAASVFTCSMFLNVGIFGGMASYVMFGDQGYFCTQLFNVFVIFIYFSVGFPVSEMVARGGFKAYRPGLDWLAKNKVAFIPLTAISTGVLLRLLGVPRPVLMDDVTAVLVPLSTGLLGFSIGITLRVGRIGAYRRELSLIMLTKYVLLPMVIIPVAWLAGLHQIMGGIPFRTVSLLCFMPVAFMALVPPVIYDFDLDLANAGFLVSTASLLLLFPLLFFVLT